MPNHLAKSLSRLSREKLIDLCVSWTKSSRCSPYLISNRNIMEADEEDYLHEPAQSRRQLTWMYKTLKDDNSVQELTNLSKKDIIDRILDGDWRRGLSHHQLASIDFANLDEDDTYLRWSALKLVPLESDLGQPESHHAAKRRRLEEPSRAQSQKSYPDVTMPMFVKNLRSHISPLVKAHYHIHRVKRLGVSVLRLHIQKNGPFAPLSGNVPHQGRSATEASRIVYIALPDSCPYVYVSVSGPVNTSEKVKGSKSSVAKIDLVGLKKIILEAIPKALSRPQQRWSLEPTKLTAKNLRSLCLLRGSGKVGTTGGPISLLTQPIAQTEIPSRRAVNDDAVESVLPTQSEIRTKLVEQRFGQMAGQEHASLDRVHIRVQSLDQKVADRGKKRKWSWNEDTPAMTPMTITLSGSDVFAGLKQFALLHPEFVDMDKLPSALTGENQRSIATM